MRSTAEQSLLDVRKMGIFLHSARAVPPSLYNRDNSMSLVRHLRFETNWVVVLSLKLAFLL